jgi:hypothetical protein
MDNYPCSTSYDVLVGYGLIWVDLGRVFLSLCFV